MLAAVVLIAFAIAAIVMGAQGRGAVNTNLAEQKIVGTPDMTPAAIKAEGAKAGLRNVVYPTCMACCFAQYMKIHALEATGGQLYSQMPRYATANGKSTDVETLALKAGGKPVPNQAREVWVQETALSTALNTSYMASQIGLFGIVVGIALLLAGLGFGILAVGGALRNRDSALARLQSHGSPTSAVPATA